MKTLFLYTYDNEFIAFTNKTVAMDYAISKTKEENEIEEGEYTDQEIISDYDLEDEIKTIFVVSKIEELKAAEELKERKNLEKRYQRFLDGLNDKEKRMLNLPERVNI